MDRFLEIFGTLPRAGPGGDEFTRRALAMMTQLPATPRILDVGCGPGRQTVVLLSSTGGTVVALDLLPEMLARTRTEAAAAGVADRLETVHQDLNEMAFPPASFDAVWSEGSIYLIGFAAGLERFAWLVKPGGYLAVSDVVWSTSTPPAEAVEFWRDYPEIASLQAKRDVIRRCGLELLGDFLLPASAWTVPYYDPMEARIAEKASAWRGDADGEEVLEEARREIAVFRRCGHAYTYAFFVIRRPSG